MSGTSSRPEGKREPVRLNVYDLVMPDQPDTLPRLNWYLYQGGLGLYHSGVEVYGQEIGFGGHPYETTGVFEVEPRRAPDASYRQTLDIGYTHYTNQEVTQIVAEMGDEYIGSSYNLLDRNCNHFASELCERLCGRKAPGWVNRLAWLGTNMRFALPEGFDRPTAAPVTDPSLNSRQQNPNY